jgi:hypothetical protein
VADSPENPPKPDGRILKLFGGLLDGLGIVLKLIGAIVVIGGLAAFLFVRGTSWRGPTTFLMNRSRARDLATVCEKHAKEHGGNFPTSLMSVDPPIQEFSSDWQYRDPDSKRLYDWLYFPGATTADGAKRLILASPTASTNKDQNKSERIVAFADAHAEVWPESQYQDFLKQVARDAK